MDLNSRFSMLLAINHGNFVLRSQFIRCLRIANLSCINLRLALMKLLLVVIPLHLLSPEVVVATQVLLAILDFDLELFGGSGQGDLRIQRLAAVEGAVELLQAAVFGLPLPFVALRVRDRQRLLLVDVVDWALQRTMARILVSRMSRQIRFPTINFILL